MMEAQKIIKYLAMAFAIFLCVSILSSIMSVLVSFGNIFNTSSEITENLKDIDINGKVSILDIDVKSINVVIKEGDMLLAQTNNKHINVKQNEDKLYITQDKHNWFNNDNSQVVIYIPEKLVFDKVSIKAGAGKVEVDELLTNELYLELGAGNVEINKLDVSSKTKIDGGAGKLTINDGTIYDFDLDIGVGSITVNAQLLGDSNIDSGVGKISLNLYGSLNDYKINFDKGIGSATIDGKDMNDDQNYGTGNNTIDIDGGVGSIKIKFIN